MIDVVSIFGVFPLSYMLILSILALLRELREELDRVNCPSSREVFGFPSLTLGGGALGELGPLVTVEPQPAARAASLHWGGARAALEEVCAHGSMSAGAYALRRFAPGVDGGLETCGIVSRVYGERVELARVKPCAVAGGTGVDVHSRAGARGGCVCFGCWMGCCGTAVDRCGGAGCCCFEAAVGLLWCCCGAAVGLLGLLWIC